MVVCSTVHVAVLSKAMDKCSSCCEEPRSNVNGQPYSHIEISNATKVTKEALDSVMTSKHFSPFVSIMISALAQAGCPIDPNKHIVIEQCHLEDQVFGGFDPENNQIVLCENKFVELSRTKDKNILMDQLLSHELVHAYDFCRADIDFYSKPEHVMCSEIRAATLSGECMFERQKARAVSVGLKEFHQKCVRQAALRSFKALHGNFSMYQSQSILNKVFSSCYIDTDPFDKIPFSKKQADISYRAFLIRNRYSVF